MGALYQIEFPNGKSYIGITSGSVADRFAEHEKAARRGMPHAICRALRKHAGAASVRTLVVADDWSYLCGLEQRAIATYGTFGPGGYNMTAGGEGIPGAVYSPEARAKISRGNSGKKRSLEFKAAVSRFMKGNKFGLGKVQSAETVAKRARGIVLAGVGVSFCKRTGKWRAHISIGGKMRDLGRYADRAEALVARATAVAEYLAGMA